MSIYNVYWRNLKWHLKNPVVIVMGIIQPLFWLLLYSRVAGSAQSGNYTAFILPGLLVLMIFSSAGTCGGAANYDMRREGNLYRVLISPVRRSAVVLGQTLEAVTLALFDGAVLLLVSLCFSVRIASGFLGLLAVVILLILAALFAACISYTLSFCLPDENAFFAVVNTLVLPIFFVSTALFPQDKIGGFLGAVVRVNPFTHVINAVRGLFLDAVIDWKSVLFAGSLFLLLSILSVLLAVGTLKKHSNQQ